jgi:hypothetical protein
VINEKHGEQTTNYEVRTMLIRKVFICFATSFLLCAPAAWAADLTFGWSPNTQSILAGYMIHYGSVSGKYTEHVDVKIPATVDGAVKYTVKGIGPGLKYFACTAYAPDGLNSAYSNEVKVNVPLDAPEGFVVSAASVTYSFIPKP